MNLFEQQANDFSSRHIGPNEQETEQMLLETGFSSIKELIEKTIPETIRLKEPLRIPGATGEYQYLQEIKKIAGKNKIFTSYIGQGYFNTITPSVILRNVFENPGWYTQYTPYQAEISQGRLESLLNFQTMVSDLTGLPLANASLLDEGTAAAEAMTMFFNLKNKDHDHVSVPNFFVDNALFRQTKDILATRARPMGINLVTGDFKTAIIDESYFGAIVQYPNCYGAVEDYRQFMSTVHDCCGQVAMATDLLALTLLKPPAELGADVAIGSSQRFGVPIGFGGPHAAFFATREEFKRFIPGRIIGVSIDAQNNRALRMALQTREQHIKREKATSNICTAQALLANMAAMYAVFHGPAGLKKIAQRIYIVTSAIDHAMRKAGIRQLNELYFDTLSFRVEDTSRFRAIAEKQCVNFMYHENGKISLSIDEMISASFKETTQNLTKIFSTYLKKEEPEFMLYIDAADDLPGKHGDLERTSPYLSHTVFNSHHSETEMMRYIKSLENKDLALNTSMIPLGSCTMKLNAATELIPVSWPEFSLMHPFAPRDQWAGYQQILTELEVYLSKITGLAATSLQPNSGAQGEFAGLLTIRAYHESIGEPHRKVMLIPISAHGTNPASAVMAGMKVVVVKSDSEGHIDVDDLKQKSEQFRDSLGGLMVTYPSTHGVFEESIRMICDIIHENGGLVYMDGANMNAQVGLTSPGTIGADVCHLNLHKTFAIPHGGGGPGMGPICVTERLKPFLPGHWTIAERSKSSDGPPIVISAAPFGSASILLISYAYIKLLGDRGLIKSTEFAILNANYMKARMEKFYKILFAGANNTCAHEFIVDLRPFKISAGVEAEDVAKRLIDYGFHAPTLSFPVPGTIMIEPTESEDKAELDRFCDAMIGIFREIKSIEEGKSDKVDNVLKNAPHTLQQVCATRWNHSYSRESAAFPLPFLQSNKFWPSVSRVNNTFGDRNLICSCEPVSSYAEEWVSH